MCPLFQKVIREPILSEKPHQDIGGQSLFFLVLCKGSRTSTREPGFGANSYPTTAAFGVSLTYGPDVVNEQSDVIIADTFNVDIETTAETTIKQIVGSVLLPCRFYPSNSPK